MAFSEKLYQLRRQSGLSQEQLAEKLNVSRQAISKWESGQSFPEAEKLLAISDYFQVSLDGLMKDEAQPPEPPRAAPEPQESIRTMTLPGTSASHLASVPIFSMLIP